MSATDITKLSDNEKAELLCSYAALILHDEKLEVTSERLQTLVNSTGAHVEAYWFMLFARALKTVHIGDLLTKIGSAAPAPAAAPAAAGHASPSAGPAKGGKAAPKKEEKKEEEDAGDMGFSLFD